MDSTSAKHDFERVSEQTSRTGEKALRSLYKMLRKLGIRFYRYYQKHRSSSLKALKKDGPTEGLSLSPPLTKEEVKSVLAKAREENVLVGVREMDPEGDLGRNQSLSKREKMAKHEIKADKWKERSKTFKKISVISRYCDKQSKNHISLSKKDSLVNKDKRYVVIVNKSKMNFMADRLEELKNERIQKMANNDLEDINLDGKIDEKDYGDLTMQDVDLNKDDLGKEGMEYGTCAISKFESNYCTQRITKAEYCAMRPEMLEMSSYGAVVANEEEVIVAFPTSELTDYRKYAPIDKPIKEYGLNGAKSIETESNVNDIMTVELENEGDFKKFRDKYKDRDFFASHNGDGTISVLVRESDTKEMVHQVQTKKSATDELLKEAKEFKERNNPAIESIENSLGKAIEDVDEMELSHDS